MPSLMSVDWCYPEFLRRAEASVPVQSYDDSLRWILAYRFGTSDFHTRHLKALGWETCDVIANSEWLRERWWSARGQKVKGEADTILAMIDDFKPDVYYSQNVHGLSLQYLSEIRRRVHLMVGHCSYDTDPAWFRKYDVVFTSFPHYLERIRAQKADARLLPLAFEPSVIDEAVDGSYARDLPCVVVGGVGIDRIWKVGGQVLEEVASKVPGFRVFGYGGKSLDPNSALRKCWQGEAWGLDMYRIYARAKVVVNRHGEIASGFANNMRLYEATGCGASVVTEEAPNLRDLFIPGVEVETYSSARECVDKILDLLLDGTRRVKMAEAGRRRTLKDHTFVSRMKTVDCILREELARR